MSSEAVNRNSSPRKGDYQGAKPIIVVDLGSSPRDDFTIKVFEEHSPLGENSR